jgi:hypothetical protein
MLQEVDHGLGIRRSVPAAHVEAFEEAMMETARRAVALGVSFDRGCDLLEAAMDTAHLSKADLRYIFGGRTPEEVFGKPEGKGREQR